MDALFDGILKLVSEQGLVGAFAVATVIAFHRGWVYLRREYKVMEVDRDFYRQKYFEQVDTTKTGITTTRDMVGALGVLEDLANRIKP